MEFSVCVAQKLVAGQTDH